MMKVLLFGTHGQWPSVPFVVVMSPKGVQTQLRQDMTATPMIVVFGRLHERGGVVMSTTWDVAPYHPSTIAAVTSLIGIMPGPLRSENSVATLSR